MQTGELNSSTIHTGGPDHADGPRLLADIGGTNARFALEPGPGRIEQIKTLPAADYKEFTDAVRAYLQQAGQPPVRHAVVDIANPVQGDQIKMTNHDWSFSIEAARQLLGFDTLLLVNDFTALSMAVPQLKPADLWQIGGGQAEPEQPIGLVGAGTGLGVGGLVRGDGRWLPLASEGGHVAFAPANAREAAVLQYGWQTYEHLSAERLVSGPGLEMIHRALLSIDGHPAQELKAAQIVEQGLKHGDALCKETIDLFCSMLGTVAADLALTLGALGGIYIGGGVVPHLGEYFGRSPFRARFENKGRMSALTKKIATYVITAEYPAFIGVSAILDEKLGTAGGIPILERIRRMRPGFSPAEERVAALVLAHPRVVSGEPISEIARRAQVSQPTVIRFCRSMGCEGLADFKLKLASGVAGNLPVAHSPVQQDDGAPDLAAKVADNTIAAIMELRDTINADTLARVAAELGRAARVELYGFGSCGTVADDARQKLFSLGLECGAYVDPQLQEVSAARLKAGDAAVFISDSGKLGHLSRAMELALASGATVIALAPAQSQLARRAHHALAVEHDEDAATQMPMLSRTLFLLVVDMLVVSLSLSREAQA